MFEELNLHAKFLGAKEKARSHAFQFVTLAEHLARFARENAGELPGDVQFLERHASENISGYFAISCGAEFDLLDWATSPRL